MTRAGVLEREPRRGLTRRCAVAVMAALCLAAAPPAAAPHFTFSVPPGPDEILVPWLTSALEAERSRLAGSGATVPDQTEVVVTPDRRELARATGLDVAPSAPAACGNGKLVLVTPRAAAGGYPWVDAAVREYARCAASPQAAGHPATYALRWKGEAAAKAPDRPELVRDYTRLGDLLRARGRNEAARIEYAKAVRRGGAGDPDLVARWAQVSLATGNAAGVEDPLRDGAKAHPNHPALQAALGRFEAQRGSWSAARDAYLAAIRVDPFDAGVHAGLADALEKLGDASGASREKQIAEMLRKS